MKKIAYLVFMNAFVFQFQFAATVYGSEMQSFETEGSVAFIGSYQSVGSPNPPPGSWEIPYRPLDSLPQTGSLKSHKIILLGSLILGIVSRRVGYKVYNIRQKKKAGNSS